MWLLLDKARRKVKEASNIFIKEGIVYRPGDLRVNPCSKLTDIPGPLFGIKDFIYPIRVIGLGLGNLAVQKLKTEIAKDKVVVFRRRVF